MRQRARQSVLATLWIAVTLGVFVGGLAWGSIQPRDPAKCSRVVVGRILAGQGVVLVPWSCPQFGVPPGFDVSWPRPGFMRVTVQGQHVATIISRPVAFAPAAAPVGHSRRRVERTYWADITTSSGKRERAQITEVEEERR